MVLSPKIDLSETKKKIHVQDYNVLSYIVIIMLIIMLSEAKKQIHVQDDNVCLVDFVSVLSVENTR